MKAADFIKLAVVLAMMSVCIVITTVFSATGLTSIKPTFDSSVMPVSAIDYFRYNPQTGFYTSEYAYDQVKANEIVLYAQDISYDFLSTSGIPSVDVYVILENGQAYSVGDNPADFETLHFCVDSTYELMKAALVLDIADQLQLHGLWDKSFLLIPYTNGTGTVYVFTEVRL